ncbi:hypothetical protein Nocox_35450 [Nonomuraea coxensis DSM 45129]|uniref:DUF234 domain-containing protein n=1 Tax=Nonomuraea coxensis DSM 45129 TaxID=1122611 RepID=A0ABX8UCX4_9ACTN|nr:hypothetical protein [Nonomuraea coxensis]QYC44649.1 hypothetical protein Nocox_35450 [Nonomuraea coxensis DSM 45129]
MADFGGWVLRTVLNRQMPLFREARYLLAEETGIRSRSRFLSQVVGPHFESLCREWATLAGPEVFGDLPGAVAAGTVADPHNRTRVEVDVAVLAPEEHGRPRRVLSLGEVKWDKVLTLGHADRLRRARDLLAVKGVRHPGHRAGLLRRRRFPAGHARRRTADRPVGALRMRDGANPAPSVRRRSGWRWRWPVRRRRGPW